MEKTQVKNLGEALSVFVQVAELAQSRGILSFDDAIVAKSAIDFVAELSKQAQEAQENQVVGSTETQEPVKAKRSKATSTEG